MNKKIGMVVMGAALSAALAFGFQTGDAAPAKADTASGTAPAVTETPADAVTGPAIDVSKISLNKKSIIIKAGKSQTLGISGTESVAVWTSANTKIAKVSAKGKVTGVKKGSTTVTASVDGASFVCKVKVVDKMSKKDFGKFSGENFVSFCNRKGYSGGYAWTGQWKGESKKRSTYRGIKIDATSSKVAKAYGDFTLNKCKSGDPFTKMKGLKKNKVKYYNDETWGKYRIRFYYNKNKKVVAIILACNISKIKKSALKSYI